MEYPKILIVGQYFTTTSGGGITLSNLFKEWKREHIAVAAEDIQNPNISVCNKYCQLGSLEFKKRFPFNIKSRGGRVKSGPLTEQIAGTNIDINKTVEKSSGLRKIYTWFLYITGLNNYRWKFEISEELSSWIKEYSPDIIYSQLSSVELIDFVSDLKSTLALPVAIHIMDDWPIAICKKGIFKSFWHKRADRKFRKLLADSEIYLSISEAMSEEYGLRYNKNFIPFHNPIDLQQWVPFSKSDYDLKEVFIILYAGRIGIGIRNSLMDVAEAINNLVSKGLKIEFHIQSTRFDPVLDDLKKYKFVKLLDPVSYKELPEIFSKSDVLLLANDFDERSISFLRYSMPTKASEFMISGAPILVYSSNETAVTKHAVKNKWAYVVSEKDKIKLETGIHRLYEDKELRKKLGTTAKQFAINNYDSAIVRDNFRKAFILK